MVAAVDTSEYLSAFKVPSVYLPLIIVNIVSKRPIESSDVVQMDRIVLEIRNEGSNFL